MSSREAILVAALSLVDERGAVGLSAEEIRVRAGVSVGSLYHHFPGGKPDVVAALLGHWLCQYRQEASQVLLASTGYADGVRRVVRHFLGWVEEHPAPARVLLRFEQDSAIPVGSWAASDGAGFAAEIADWLTRHCPASGHPIGLPVAWALWIGPAKEYSRAWLGSRAPSAPGEVAADLAAAAWDALRERRLAPARQPGEAS